MDHSNLAYYECADCGRHYTPELGQQRCECAAEGGPMGGILLARYDLATMANRAYRERIEARSWNDGLWRYAELLPLRDAAHRVTLGEGCTPLLPLPALSAALDIELTLKDEGLNPTGTFKARGATVGVSCARELGATTIALPTAGNAGAAWAAYGARAGIPVVVAMPKDAPLVAQREVQTYGGRLHLVDGLISDAGKWVAAQARDKGWFDASGLKEPYRLEGKKTMGLELAEQLGWLAPDVVLYPTGGGIGLIAIWKAFEELRQLGWIGDGPLPRMVAVQAAGCAPVARGYAAGAERTEFWAGAQTIAAGLRVPGPIGGGLTLRAVRETNGTAITVEDDEIRAATSEMARLGFWVSPEGAALLPALRKLRAADWIKSGERVVMLNTGSGLIYPDLVN